MATQIVILIDDVDKAVAVDVADGHLNHPGRPGGQPNRVEIAPIIESRWRVAPVVQRVTSEGTVPVAQVEYSVAIDVDGHCVVRPARQREMRGSHGDGRAVTGPQFPKGEVVCAVQADELGPSVVVEIGGEFERHWSIKLRLLRIDIETNPVCPELN